MRVCIVGATGGVGQWLVRAVLDSGEFCWTAPSHVGPLAKTSASRLGMRRATRLS